MPPRKDVKMDVKHRLPCTGVIVRHYPESAFGKTLLPCQRSGDLVDMADQFVVGWIEVKCVDKMLLWYDEKMYRRSRRDILHGNHPVILEYLFGGYLTTDDTAKDAILHVSSLR